MQLPGTRLHVVEQPGVLDRNHSLIGESCEQRYFLLFERSRRLPHDANRSDAALMPQHGCKDARIVADPIYSIANALGKIGYGDGLRDIYDPPLPERSPSRSLV